MKKPTFDVMYSPSGVLLVTTDRGAAERIAAAVEAERASLFQMEGLSFSIKESDRAPEEAEAPKEEKKPKK